MKEKYSNFPEPEHGEQLTWIREIIIVQVHTQPYLSIIQLVVTRKKLYILSSYLVN